ncbi:ATP-dependent zinc metalloprotease FtsH [Ureaplasma miroungigenitalium]|nr:ATP-dependent zinc metalloprotease FtsH [Ureaplasma miroungigenitalium]MCV3734378.1 ATP-dependent zinc metalloprotease FtsH [Ureaplasma miroungigenitalium]
MNTKQTIWQKMRHFFANDSTDDKPDLSQPKKPNLSSEDKKRNKRKIIIIAIVITLLVALAIGLIVYFSLPSNEVPLFVKSAVLTNNGELKIYADPYDSGQATILAREGLNTFFIFKPEYLANPHTKIFLETPMTYQIAYRDPTSGYIFEFRVAIDKEKTDYLLGSTHLSELFAGQNNWFHQSLQRLGYRPQGFDARVIISPIISILLMFIFIYLFSRMARAQNDAIMGSNKQSAKLTRSNVRFYDVAGIAEVKNELIEIVDFLKNPKKYVAAGARIPKGVMLYGPPGTGKTLIAKAVAGEANVPFFQTTGSSFEDTFVGVGARRVRELFAKAKKVAPAIIFIDEIDSVAKKRGNSLNNLQDQTINQLLSELDGFETSSGVIVMAATNRLDTLDEAILRPGRFDRHISVNLPDLNERRDILKIHAKNKNISKKVELLEVARRTPGFSGAQLENVLNEAALLAVRDNSLTIKMAHLDEAIDRVVAGPARPHKVIEDYEKKQIAYHEAGHALAGLYAPGTEIVQKITIIPRGQALGYTLQTPEKAESVLQTKQQLLNHMRVALAGRAAEEIIFGLDQITTGAANDFYKVARIARGIVAQFGMTDFSLAQLVPTEGVDNPYRNTYSEQTAYKIDQEVEKLVQQEYKNAKQVIMDHRDELELMVETLLELETILRPQIQYIHEHKQLPPEVLTAREERLKNATNLNDNE